MIKRFIELSLNKPKVIIWSLVALTAIALFQFPRIKVDTDPENMLSEQAPARVFHRDVKKEFAIYDLIVVGIVNDKNPDGVFNIKTLTKIYNITEEIKKIDGVISAEIIAPSTKDNIQQAGVGTVRFNWLMENPPKTL